MKWYVRYVSTFGIVCMYVCLFSDAPYYIRAVSTYQDVYASVCLPVCAYCILLRQTEKKCDCLGMFEKCARVYLKNCQNWLASIWAISVQIFPPEMSEKKKVDCCSAYS